jgi:glutaredoxin 3
MFQPTIQSRRHFGKSLSMQMSSAEDFAKQEISKNKVVVFSKSYCPYCSATKALFEDLRVDAAIYELNELDNGQAIQDALLKMTGQRTVPNVFINGQHIGGNDKTQALNSSGKLKTLLGI